MDYDEGWGRLRVSSPQRSNAAQDCELGFWRHTKVPERNAYQMHMFDRFKSLPERLGHALEFGAGPYTKLRLILESGTVRRTVDTATMIDPLAFTYVTDALVHSSYKKGSICLNQSRGFAGGCIPTMVGSFGAEVPMPASAYDTVIIANTIEHCQDAMDILQNIWNSLRPGGYLVFGEEVASVNARTDLCHPLRITFKFYHMWLNKSFRGGIKLFAACGAGSGWVTEGRPDLCQDAPRGHLHSAAVQNTVYAIAQKSSAI